MDSVKYIFLIILSFFLISCEEKNAAWYWNHPYSIQAALDKCPQTQPQGVSCEQLNEIAVNITKLAKEMQYNPFQFGQSIIALQKEMSSQQHALEANPNDLAMQSALEKSKEEIAHRLAIIKLQGSPKA